MKQKQERFTRDVIVIVISIGVAFYLVDAGWTERLIALLDGNIYLGSFMAGALFTSVFTTAPAVGFLSELAHQVPLVPLVLLGSAGATIVDHVLFHLLRHRIVNDAEYLINASPGKQLLHIARRRSFHRFFPLIGAILLASPLPDEPALMFLGLSSIPLWAFVSISFVTHALGIWAIAGAALAVGG